MTMEQLAIQLLELPTKARALLAQKLIASLDDDREADVAALWVAEAERRATEAEKDQGRLRPAEDVLAEARSRLD